MADSYSVVAMLTAKDNMTSTFSKAASATQSLGSKIKSTIGLGAMMQVGMSAVSTTMRSMTSNIGAAVSRYDQLNNFPKVMKNLGIESKASNAALKQINKGIKGLPTTLDSATRGVTRFTSSNGNIKKSTKYFLAMNNAIIAGNQSTEIQSSAIEQLSQAYSKGKMDMMEWRSIQTAIPGQLNQIAKAMGVSTNELGEGLRNGTISMDEFMDTMVKLDKEGVDGFASFAEQAKDSVGGVRVAFTNLSTAVTRGIANCIGSTDKMLAKNGLPTIGEMAIKAGDAVEKAFEKTGKAIEKVNLEGIIAGATPYWKAFKTVVGGVGEATKKVAGFLNDHAETVTKLIPLVWGLGAAFGAYNKIAKFIPGLKTMSQIFSKMAGGLIAKLAPQLFTTAAAEQAVGKEAGKATKRTNSFKKTLASAASIVAVGAAVILISIGLSMIAESAVKVAKAGGPAIATMFGMVVAVGALAIGMMFAMKALSQTPKKAYAGAAALLAIGVAVLLVAAGFALMTNAAISLAGAGGAAIAVMGGMVLALAGLALGASMIGGALTAGALGFIAFGAAILMVGAGVALASLGLATLSKQLPTIATYGKAAAGAITSLGGSLIVFAAGALLAGAGCIVLGAGLIVAAAGMAVGAAGMTILSAGVVVLSGGMLILWAALKLVSSSMKTIASSAKRAQNSLKNMRSSVKIAGNGLDAIGNKAKSAMSKLTSAFSNAAGKAKSSGQKLGTGFTSGMKGGLGKAPSTATHAINSVVSKLRAGRSRVYNAGSYISQGFAAGMRSSLGEIRSAAEEMAKAADKAVRAKAEIKSPSKVAKRDGAYWGDGWVGGILSRVRDARKAAQELVQMPRSITSPKLSLSLATGYNGSLDTDNYEYYKSAEYTIVVPVEVDGREVAKVTAPYTEAELNKRQQRSDRSRGVR